MPDLYSDHVIAPARTRITIFCALSLLAATRCRADDTGLSEGTLLELDYLRAAREDLRTKAKSPLKELEEKYLTAVSAIKEKAMVGGEAIIAVEAEESLKELSESGIPDGESGHPPLTRLEEIYLEKLPEVQKQIVPGLIKADQEYGLQLRRMLTELLKEGETRQAAILKKQMDELAAEITKVRSGGSIQEVRAKAEAKPEVVILKATFSSGEASVDVTRKVAEHVASGRDFSANPIDLGVDPRPYHRKRLHISYLKDGIAREQNRGENEILLIQSFTHPHDVKEMVAWLIGTTWKSDDREITFEKDGKISGKEISAKWEPDGMYRFTIHWGRNERTNYAMQWRWARFIERGGYEEVFKAVAE